MVQMRQGMHEAQEVPRTGATLAAVFDGANHFSLVSTPSHLLYHLSNHQYKEASHDNVSRNDCGGGINFGPALVQ
jgi:hypothetical protein